MGDGLPAWRVLLATVLVDFGLAAIVGAWASMLWLDAATLPWSTRSRRRSRAALRVALVFTLASDAVLLWLQAAYMAEKSLMDAAAMLPQVLEETYVGRSWAGGVLGLLFVFVATAGPALRRGILRLAVAALGITVFVYSRAAVSHAGDFGLASLQLLVECTHFWAISLWLGIVGIAAFAVLDNPIGITAIEQAAVAAWLQTLSAVATGALAAVFGTGLFNAWRGIGSPANLVESTYGYTLLVKVSMVTIAVALGAFNRFRVLPHLVAALCTPFGLAAPPLARFVRVLRIEAAFLCAALIAAAVLSSSPLPSGP